MNKSDSIANICAALIKFQSKVEPAQKDSENPHFKSKFASLSSIIDACRDLLVECDLAITQVNQPTEPGLIAMETMLMHTSGEWVSGTIVLPMTKLDPQQAGSANTYARRYGLAAILGIVQEDDDAETHRTETAKTKFMDSSAPNAVLETEKAALHKAQNAAFASGLFTADELINFNMEYLGVEKTANAKSIDKLAAAAKRFNMWRKQRKIFKQAPLAIKQKTHRENFLVQHIGVIDPYACEDSDKLDKCVLEIQDRIDAQTVQQAEAV